jgi:glutamyl-tRNA(Gln) amidotransferase subunit E
LKSLRREGFDLEPFSEDALLALFKTVDEGVIAKEAIPEVFRWLGSHEDAEICDAVEALGLRMISPAEVETIVNQVIQANEELIRQRGLSALSPLMGVIMKTYRGRVDAKQVSQILKEKIAHRGG